MENYICLLTTAMTRNIHITVCSGEKISSEELVDIVGEMKLLSAALDARLV